MALVLYFGEYITKEGAMLTPNSFASESAMELVFAVIFGLSEASSSISSLYSRQKVHSWSFPKRIN